MAELGLEEMRSCMLEALRSNPNTQDVGLRNAVYQVAKQRGLIEVPRQSGNVTHFSGESNSLPRALWGRYRDVLWGLITEGVVAIGIDDGNSEWPWLGVTEYGKECLSAGEIVPHDSEGYLRKLSTIRPLDDAEKRYLPQALEAFRRNLPDASAMMLGCASEHLLLVLGEKIASAEPDLNRAKTTRKKLEGPALTLLRHLNNELQQRGLQRKLEEQRPTTFDGIAQLIRVARNDAGHPDLRPVSRDECFNLLRLFPGYREWIMAVIVLL